MPVQISGTTIEGLGNIPKNAEHSCQYLLLRLLLGTARVSRGVTSGKQTTDYSSLPAIAQTKTPAVAIKDFLTDYAIGGSIARFIKSTLADNREFYKEILSEFLNYQIQNMRGSHTAAFVFLYRILERISYTVPLLYASTQSDYRGTFRELKAILHDVEGELGLFKKFLKGGNFIDSLKLQVRQQISFATTNANGIQYYELTTQKYKGFDSCYPATQNVEIEFINIPEFLITIRNRFFHSRTGDGKENITTIHMLDSDEYFERINPVIVSFLAIVTLQTFSIKYHV